MSTTTESRGGTRGPAAGLWRDPDFRLFWGGQAVSLVGAQITVVALPLIGIEVLRASEESIGVLQACGYLPFIGLPLLAGVVADRHRKRPVMMTTNLIRAILLLGVPLVAWTGGLSMPLLYAVALVSGACAVFFEIAEMAYIPALVGRDRLGAANSVTIAASSAAATGGPGIGGLVVQALGPVGALAIDGIGYVVSFLTLRRIRFDEPRPEPTTCRLRAEVLEGLRVVFANRPIRMLALYGMTYNCCNQVYYVAFLLLALREHGIGAGWYGLLLALQGAASVIGAAAAPFLADRLGYGWAFIGCAVVSSAPLLVMAIGSLPVWAIALFVAGLGAGVTNVVSYTLRQALTPDRLLGRMSASMRLVLYAGIPVGATLGGYLAGTHGAATTVAIGAAGTVAGIPLLVGLQRIRALPAAAES